MNDINNSPRTRDDAIDPALESLLDEALGAPEPPTGMADRIVAATEARLPGRDAHTVAPHRARREGVLARIGLTSAWRAAAAVAVVGLLGAGLLAVLSADQNNDVPGPGIVGHMHEPTTQRVALSRAEQRELLAAFAAAEGVDFESYWTQRLLAYNGEFVSSAEDDDRVWSGSDDPVDMLLDTYEVEWLGADGPRMFF
ncbi:hypothetical protein ACERK3_18220 [Phycisphaerales bacterium AB-hyl4]|uniref:Uncharacterized protein n=1 Tax=Natronomicrosphaera hydrolytica TaxID=3242702 RepID=A0ABV4UAV2_9BACT